MLNHNPMHSSFIVLLLRLLQTHSYEISSAAAFYGVSHKTIIRVGAVWGGMLLVVAA